MIDWLSSKLAMMVAALVILGTIVGLFAWQRKNLEISELHDTAELIAKSVNELSSTTGNTYKNVTFDDQKEGVYLKSQIGSKGYGIKLARNMVTITQDNSQTSSNFVYPIHLWKPSGNNCNRTQLNDSDQVNKQISFDSGTDFTIQRMSIEISGLIEYHTFIYKR